jgi:hypothetical protein
MALGIRLEDFRKVYTSAPLMAHFDLPFDSRGGLTLAQGKRTLGP